MTNKAQLATTIPVKIYTQSRLMAEGLRELLGQQKGLSVVAICSNQKEWEESGNRQARIVIADIDSFYALKEDQPPPLSSPKILLVWESWRRQPVPGRLQKLVSQGLSGIIPPESTIELLTKSIKAVDEGELWLNRKLLETMIASESKEQPSLTKQERKVVQLICQGHRNKEIADKLDITEQTVKSHCNRIYKKLGVTDRLQLALYGYKNGEGSDELSH